LLAIDAAPLMGSALPQDPVPWTDYPWGPDYPTCGQDAEWLTCGHEAVSLVARRHEHPVLTDERVWLRVAGLEFQRFAAQTLPDGGVRLGHPNPPHAGWEVWGLPAGAPALGVEVGHVTLTGDGVRGLDGAGWRMRSCAGVQVEGFPLQVLFDPQGELRMLRLQALPETGLPGVDAYECVARALNDVRPMPGVTSAELQLSRALE
jgi:hypothetical protein